MSQLLLNSLLAWLACITMLALFAKAASKRLSARRLDRWLMGIHRRLSSMLWLLAGAHGVLSLFMAPAQPLVLLTGGAVLFLAASAASAFRRTKGPDAARRHRCLAALSVAALLTHLLTHLAHLSR